MTIITTRTDLRPVNTELCPRCGDVAYESPRLGTCCREAIGTALCESCEAKADARRRSAAWVGNGAETASLATWAAF